MATAKIVSAQGGGLKVNVYIGVGMVLLTYDLDKSLCKNLAGFAIKCYPPRGEAFYLQNRLSFEDAQHFKGYTKDTTPQQRVWFDSIEAPFQYFRWLHVPAQLLAGTFTYEVMPMYFGPKTSLLDLKPGPSVKVEVELFSNYRPKFDVAFTRGYLSSQAYHDRFQNRDIRPKGAKAIDYDTKPFQAQYEWLGGKAHKMIFDFLKECASEGAAVKAMLYDCDHPDFIDYLASFGGKLKVIIDDAPLHHDSSGSKPEDRVAARLDKTTNGQMVRGNYARFQHNKVLIKIVNGKAQKVITGSANFSIRGLYAQANNCLLIDDARVAAQYEAYFDASYADMQAGKSGLAVNKLPLTKEWTPYKGTGFPSFQVCLSPHADPALSLDKIETELKKADSSVLFSIMEMDGGGTPLQMLKGLPSDKGHVFHYGITQKVGKDDNEETGDYELTKQGQNGGTVPFSYLTGKVPPPFNAEFSGGMGQIIHDKFIVIDFNSSDPVVFTGSSNLSSGGEKQNGDNLLAIYDRDIAIAYAVEAIRLFDHYNFRYAMKKATDVKPLALQNSDAWTEAYYTTTERKCQDRLLFSAYHL